MAKLNVNIRSPSFHTNFIASLWQQGKIQNAEKKNT